MIVSKRCPVCKTDTKNDICEKCGYDFSLDFLSYPTCNQIQDGDMAAYRSYRESIERKYKAAQEKVTETQSVASAQTTPSRSSVTSEPKPGSIAARALATETWNKWEKEQSKSTVQNNSATQPPPPVQATTPPPLAGSPNGPVKDMKVTTIKSEQGPVYIIHTTYFLMGKDNNYFIRDDKGKAIGYVNVPAYSEENTKIMVQKWGGGTEWVILSPNKPKIFPVFYGILLFVIGIIMTLSNNMVGLFVGVICCVLAVIVGGFVIYLFFSIRDDRRAYRAIKRRKQMEAGKKI